MARVLVLSFRAPYPLTEGFKLRAYHLARLLARDHEVDLLCLHDRPLSTDEHAHLASLFRRVIVVPHRGWRARLQAALALPSSKPLQLGYYRSRRLRRWITAHGQEYDLVFGFHLRMAPYMADLPALKALDLIDAASLFYEGAQAYATGLWRRIYQSERARVQSYEAEVLGWVDKAFVASPYDAAHLRSRVRQADRLVELPNGVRESLLEAPLAARTTDPALAFLGKMDYAPNVDAARHFASEIFPRLRRSNPDLGLWIIGTQPRPAVRALADIPGVTVTGHSDDPFALVQRARLVVAPLRYGAGIPNKVLEAMALGKAVVASEAGVRGIEGEAGRHYEIPPNDAAWPASIDGLLADPERRRRLGANARTLVMDRYRWDRVGNRLRCELAPLLSP
ncbi:MAG: glycosyltransferase family 4 protein [Salinibacter sp.]